MKAAEVSCYANTSAAAMKNWMELSFHPVLNLQTRNAIEMLNVVCDHSKAFADSLSSNVISNLKVYHPF